MKIGILYIVMAMIEFFGLLLGFTCIVEYAGEQQSWYWNWIPTVFLIIGTTACVMLYAVGTKKIARDSGNQAVDGFIEIADKKVKDWIEKRRQSKYESQDTKANRTIK